MVKTKTKVIGVNLREYNDDLFPLEITVRPTPMHEFDYNPTTLKWR